jgi:hypothetical protein
MMSFCLGVESEPMNYFIIEPDVAASLGEETVLDAAMHPPRVEHLHIVMEGWFGDGLLEVFPCFLFREDLSKAIKKADLVGVEFTPLTMTVSEEFRHQSPRVDIPVFIWGKIVGAQEQSDFFLTDGHKLVVSDRALEILESFNIANAKVEQVRN